MPSDSSSPASLPLANLSMSSSPTVDTTNFSRGVLSDALEGVGHTPLVQLSTLAKDQGLACNLIAKVDFLSVGGSTKDRIAKAMVLQAEKDGVLIPGKSVVIEPTSGNTGIGLAMACTLRGYQCIITMPVKMSLEKEATLRSMGAEVIRTPNEKAWNEVGSHIEVAERLCAAIPHAVILNQYTNRQNPLAHYLTTWPEINYSIQTSDLPRKTVDVFFAGAGTGGTIMGVSRGMKEAQTGTDDAAWNSGDHGFVVGVDPVGSILAQNGEGDISGYEVEGIGYDFIPEVLNPISPQIHHWVKSTDAISFEYARKAHKLEGLLVGGSSGSALSSACVWLKDTRPFPLGGYERFGSKKDVNVVILLADGVRNYLSKEWFLQRSTWGKSDLATQIGEILGPRDGEKVEKALPSPPDSDAEKAV
ncbi:tryptophan synthase beta subunit-like PLP-dependent enzyme [Mrakia frigida]|uniref:cysteine synthase family protein n=1 Tax=Mrakia frigida TaxID=29902 RepID=UPI003FCC2122